MRIRSVARLMVTFKESLHSIIVFIVTQLPILPHIIMPESTVLQNFTLHNGSLRRLHRQHQSPTSDQPRTKVYNRRLQPSDLLTRHSVSGFNLAVPETSTESGTAHASNQSAVELCGGF